MKKDTILVTGGVGFVGSNLVPFLLKKGIKHIVIFDKLASHTIVDYGSKVTYVKGNITSEKDVQEVFKQYGPFSTVYHLASAMPNKEVSDPVMWEVNVIGTRNLITEAVKHNVKHFIFTSSNVTYGIPKTLPVTEKTPLAPLEMYGRSKQQAEKELEKFKDSINIQIIRCPVITGVGRLGLQAILYEFISENKRVYMLGSGSNKYQFIDVMDICSALEKASHIRGFDIYYIGADEVLSLRELYEGVIKFAKSKSTIVPLPMWPALGILAILDKLNISPLGVYQYTMMGRSIYANTEKIKKKLGWQPKKTNLDTFIENYQWYTQHKGRFTEIGSGDFSANRSVPKMGIFKILKALS